MATTAPLRPARPFQAAFCALASIVVSSVAPLLVEPVAEFSRRERNWESSTPESWLE